MIEIVICLCGKRKSGKDFVAEYLRMELSNQVDVSIRAISHPLKDEYARLHGLDAQLLRSDNVYKEQYRAAMVAWSDRIRVDDPEYFCRTAMSTCRNRVVIVSDCRRPGDLRFFQRGDYRCLKNGDYRCLIVRVCCDLTIRQLRGFEFISGIDDSETECGLDQWEGQFDFEVNNNDLEQLKKTTRPVIDQVLSTISK